ncbi:MAG: rhodanese-like domain-containing protein [Bacilli bacterium]|nr:rhodanese-like domain-containing protein [Bacilli bacterium]
MNISINDLKGLMKKGRINLIDIRSYSRYREGSIEGAVNISADQLINSPSKYLNLFEEYYFFCEHGYTSRRVVSFLNKLGYRVFNIEGGFSLYNKKR